MSLLSLYDAQLPPPPLICHIFELLKHGGRVFRPASSFIPSRKESFSGGWFPDGALFLRAPPGPSFRGAKRRFSSPNSSPNTGGDKGSPRFPCPSLSPVVPMSFVFVRFLLPISLLEQGA
jgi:hypothetical protein